MARGDLGRGGGVRFYSKEIRKKLDAATSRQTMILVTNLINNGLIIDNS